MNPAVTGPLLWNVFLNFPDCFPEEILSSEQSVFAINFIYFSIKIFMCKSCSSDGLALLRNHKFFKKIGIHFNGFYLITRYSIRKFIYNFHNVVNKKLGKPEYAISFEATIKEDVHNVWKQNYLQFLTLLCFYYPSDSDPDWKTGREGEQYHAYYYQWNKNLTRFYIKYYFQEIVTKAFGYFGMFEKINMFEAKIIWQDRNNLVRAFLEEKKKAYIRNSIDDRQWDFTDSKIFADAIRAKGKSCGVGGQIGTIFQGCQ